MKDKGSKIFPKNSRCTADTIERKFKFRPLYAQAEFSQTIAWIINVKILFIRRLSLPDKYQIQIDRV